ncbi:hypothetical protein DEIPH_ctg041orf0024 [Deinococcus phoenicis]|uniref:Uncharacterized protein n=1 Tax=Deinococcus phoenicis TaxID=1476583 RepID=A0A016QMQ1_9DEIO|nr:hypothetical protein [Deinococcus phoenicis]EYB67425.1 hypothetical protein DEIPH_ctg041orf0024 [Deinococcus phoenicis]
MDPAIIPIITAVIGVTGTVAVGYMGFLHNRLSAAKSAEQAMIERLEKRLDKQDAEIKELEQKLAKTEQRAETLERENDQLKERVRKLEGERAAVELLNATLTAENERLKTDLQTATRHNGELLAQVNDLEFENQAQAQKIAELQGRLAPAGDCL